MWNNIANKNATTVEKLAQGMAKAGATANAFGLDMNSLNAIVGTVTAATKQSGNEVGNFVKSVLPRLLSQPAQDALKSLNVQFMDAKTGDMRNVIDIYAEVAQKVQGISRAEKAAVMEGLAGKFHISRMTALLDNWKLFEKILNDSKNSMGSAAKENDTYMKSLTARINLMKQKFESLALVFGESFVTEGFIQSLEGLKGIAEEIGTLVKTVGGLPLILGGVSSGIAMMSTSFRGLLVEGGLLNGMFVKMGISATGMGLALRTAIASTGIGLAFVAVGTAIDFFLRKTGEARQKSEELETKNRELTKTYSEHRKDVQELSAEYSKYENVIRNGKFGVDFNTYEVEKYRESSNKLAELMPDLVQGEDQYGNKIIGSNEKIKARIELLEKQLVSQQKLDAINKKQEVEDSFSSAKDSLKDLNKEMDNFLVGRSSSLRLKSIDDMYGRFEKLQSKISKVGGQDKLSYVESENYDYLKGLINEYESLGSDIESAKSSYQKSIMDMIDVNVKLDSSTSTTTKSLINDFTTFVATADASDGKISKVLDSVLNSVKNDSGFKNTLQGYSQALKEYQDSINNNSDPAKIEEYKNKATTAFESVRTTLINLAKDGKLSKENLSVLSSQLNGTANAAFATSIDFDKLSQSTGKTKEELMANLALAPDLSGEMSGLADSTDDAAAADMSKASSAERIIGVTEDQINSVNEAIASVQSLSQMENLSADQSVELANAKAYLAGIYPYLVENGNLNIEMMARENYASSVLLQAFQDLAAGKLNQEQSMSLVAAQGSKNRIAILSKELQFLQQVVDQFNQIASQKGDPLNGASTKYAQNEKLAMKAAQKIPTVQAKLGIDTSAYNAQIDALANSLDMPAFGSTKKPSELAKAAKSSSPKSSGSGSSDKTVEIYQIDKYKMKIDELDNTLQQSEFLQKRMTKGSAEYTKELEKQSSTLNEMSQHTLGQIDTLKKRNSAVQSQINSMGDANRLSNDQKEILNGLRKELEANTSEINSLTDAWRGYQDQLLTMQQDIRDSISESIAKEEADRVKILEQEIEDTNKLYEDQIALKQEQLDMLDEIIEKEDRIANIQSKNDELTKAKSDTRYSYITAQGEEILTYNKEQVSELEKARDEMLKEYERSDLKKALSDEIDRLNKAKDAANKALQKRLDDFKVFWDAMVDAAKNGTLNYTTLVQAWQDTSITSLRNHVLNTGAELNKIGGLYQSMTVIQRNMDVTAQQINSSLSAARNQVNTQLSSMSNDVANATGSVNSALHNGMNAMLDTTHTAQDQITASIDVVLNKYQMFIDALKRFKDTEKNQGGISIKTLEAEKLALKSMQSYNRVKQYHEGGIVATHGGGNRLAELANKMFNVRPGEIITKQLIGELNVPPKNIPNIFTNINNMVGQLMGNRQAGMIDQSKNIRIDKVELKANNPTEMFAGLSTYLGSQ